MKIKELIIELQKEDPDAEIVLFDTDEMNYYPINDFEVPFWWNKKTFEVQEIEDQLSSPGKDWVKAVSVHA